jgi:hypothetical protein
MLSITKILESQARDGIPLSQKEFNRLKCALRKQDAKEEYDDEECSYVHRLSRSERKNSFSQNYPTTLSPKIIMCGPACNLCYYAVTENKLEIDGETYHAKCYPCGFCGNIKNKIPVGNGGFHPMCRPCEGCLRPFVHISQSVYCSYRCSTKASILDIIIICARRLNIHLNKDVLVLICGFTFENVPKNANRSLDSETLQIIAMAESKRQEETTALRNSGKRIRSNSSISRY